MFADQSRVCPVFFFFFLPEMKGRTLEELDELFQNRVSVRDFPGYECLSSERAKEVALKITAEHSHIENSKLGAVESTKASVEQV
jgi:hypothetical protein